MRRGINNNDDELSMKIIKYTGIGVAILAIIVFSLLIYSKNLNDEVKDGTLTSEQLSSILNNTNTSENTESASSEIGKSVNEATNELKENTTINNVNNATNTSVTNSKNNNENVLNTNKVRATDTTKQTNSKAEETKKNEENKKAEENKQTETATQLNFERPVEGDIVRDFAVDNLIYSETLQEWTTHTGIDIKADKTTVVKSAEAGTVKTIKNDPRYGLTIVVEHEGGFQTVYSNLLTSEFVVEGEKVEKGQSLGTVGNTAAFEIADEPHLHFEILKDSVYVDPNIYLK